MTRDSCCLALLLIVAGGGCTERTPEQHREWDAPIAQQECCDGSGGVALDRDHFLVANDEDGVLRIYRREGGAGPVIRLDVRKFLDLRKKEEPDIEGLTRIGSVIYAIASHSRSSDGDKLKERRRFFALQWDPPRLEPLGRPHDDLLDAMQESTELDGIDLGRKARVNIEGLAATPRGEVLIGFRSPLIGDRALLVPLTNPREVVAGAHPRFAPARHVDLDGGGIRGIEGMNDTYVLASETPNGSPTLRFWTPGKLPGKPLSLPPFLNPEAVVLFPDTGLSEIHLLSDDGNADFGGDEDCKDIDDPGKKRFMRFLVRPRTVE